MSLWLKAAFLNGRGLLLQPLAQRLPQTAYEQKRTAYFTMGKQRMGRRKGIKPRPVEEKIVVKPSALYEEEIGSAVFEDRAKDEPQEVMENPFTVSKRKCVLCQHGITPDYKNVKLLSQFVSPHTGKIYGRHITGLCKDQQERVEAEVVKSRSAGLMAQYFKHPEFFKDPKLCDPTRPKRPHPH